MLALAVIAATRAGPAWVMIVIGAVVLALVSVSLAVGEESTFGQAIQWFVTKNGTYDRKPGLIVSTLAGTGLLVAGIVLTVGGH